MGDRLPGYAKHERSRLHHRKHKKYSTRNVSVYEQNSTFQISLTTQDLFMRMADSL